MLARRWISLHAGEYDRLEFNFHVGPGAASHPDCTPEQEAYWLGITQIRADIVGWQGGGAKIVEFKRRIQPSALGAALSYMYWYRMTHPQVRPISALVVGGSIGAAMPAVLDAYLVRYELLPEVFGV
jgi:hypothetical protein